MLKKSISADPRAHWLKLKRIGIMPCLALVLVFAAMDVHPAKLADPKVGMYSKIEAKADEISHKFDALGQVMQAARTTGSFVTTDFWGIKPNWYLDANLAIGSQYPFAWLWERGEGTSTPYRRVIRGVALRPMYAQVSRRDNNRLDKATIRLNFSDLFEAETGKEALIKRYLAANGIRPDALEAAYEDYVQQAMPILEDILEKRVFMKLDVLYGDLYFGRAQLSNRRFKSIFGEAYSDPGRHPEVLSKHEHDLKVGSLLKVTENDTWRQFLNRNSYAHGFRFIVSRTPFELDATDTSARASQAFDFDATLNAMVAQGYSVKTREGNYDVYADASAPGEYAGRVYFNKETGQGIWENANWSAYPEFARLTGEINTLNQQLLEEIQNYLKLTLKQVSLKYKPGAVDANPF